MARSTIVQLTDDLDGGEAVEELTFALRGTEYEIDLSAKNVAALEKALDKYMGAARKVGRNGGGGRRPRASKAASAPRSSDTSAVREWAREQGYEVSDRGRIPTEIRDAFEAARA